MAADKKLPSRVNQRAAYFALHAVSQAFRNQFQDPRRSRYVDAIRELMTELATRAHERACRFCACTEGNACIADVPYGVPIGCSWLGADVCSAPACKRARDRENDALMRKGGRRRGHAG